MRKKFYVLLGSARLLPVMIHHAITLGTGRDTSFLGIRARLKVRYELSLKWRICVLQDAREQQILPKYNLETFYLKTASHLIHLFSCHRWLVQPDPMAPTTMLRMGDVLTL